MFELVSRELFQPKSTSEQNAYQKMSDAELNQALELIGQEARALGEKNLKLDIKHQLQVTKLYFLQEFILEL